MTTKKSNSNEIRIIRIYDAPVKLVWEAWVDPKKVAQWWGPRGFTLTTRSKEVKPGGIWDYTMHGPDGVDYPNRTVFHEVEKYSKLVYDHGANESQPALFRVKVEFSEKNGKTKMDMRMILPTPEAAQEIRKFVKKAGGDSTWDRLAEFISHTENKKEIFIINRSFDVSIDTMFALWTDPNHFSKWQAPAGFDITCLRTDIKPGGSLFYLMKSNSAGNQEVKMYGRAQYIEITKPSLLKYTQQFCDENEKISRHPMSSTWPETMLTTVTFTEEDAERTRVTITWEPHGNVSPTEMETFINARAGMTQGWTGSLDKLEEYIEKNVTHK